MLVKILVLFGLLRLLIVTGNPLLCSGIYTAIVILTVFFSGWSYTHIFTSTVFGFALSSLYFILLEKFEGISILWWVIMIGGLLISIV
jgi:hypothetical protein